VAKNVQRRLAAILAADVVGYSRLMGEDEAGTLAALKAHREALFNPIIAEHQGRVVKLMGDGALMEFPSVVEAVQCAVEIQQGMAARNQGVPEDRQIRFRIGINLGDVIVDGDDIYGDGVNVAARLESLAEPGGICVRRTVRNQVRDKLPYGFEDMGAVEVKNIARPIRAFRVLTEPGVAATAGKRARFRLKPAIAAAAVVAVVAVGAIAWLQPWAPDLERPSTERATGQPSIAVLPFNNLSGDPAQDYFSDGITDDLVTDLSRISGLFVIASSTTFTYKGKPVNVQQVGRDLGVRYVLEGSVRRVGDRVRINAQLIDAASGHHLWADRYDRQLTDVFALQDEVTQKIVTALAVKLTAAEAEQVRQAAKVNPEAHDLFLRGQERLRRYTREANLEARDYFERVVVLDPEFARAYASIALSLTLEIFSGWTDKPDDVLRRASVLIQRAVELDDTLPQVHLVLSTVYRVQRRYEEALAAARQSIKLNSNFADSYAALALTLNYAGHPEKGFAAIRTAMKLNPRYGFFYLWILGQSYFLLERHEEAINNLLKSLERNPEFGRGHQLLAAAYALAGRIDDAEWEAEEVLTQLPQFSLKEERKRAPYMNPGLDRYIEGLREAGLPE
jgi:TolB-like protein/class 3 adenylate cyclase